MHRCWLAILTAVSTEYTATSGTLETLDGRRLSGELSAVGNLLAIVDDAGLTNTIALANLLATDLSPTKPNGNEAGTGLGWLGCYFPGTTGAAAPLTRIDDDIDFNWNTGEALPGFLTEAFAVSWNGAIDPPGDGEYQLHLATDGPAALFLDGKPELHVNAAGDLVERSSAIRRIEAGRRLPIAITYTNHSGPARIRLTWSSRTFARQPIPQNRIHPISPAPQHTIDLSRAPGLLGTYYATPAFSGAAFSRVDSQINFTWQDRDPVPGFSRTNSSIRWTGRLRAEHSEEYTFYATADEHVRLWIDDKPVIHRTDQFWLSESKGTAPLLAGEEHALRMEINSTSGDAIARLAWSSASTPRTNLPAANLSPRWPASSAIAEGRTPAGIVLRNGSFIAGPVERASETAVRTSGLLKSVNLTTPNVARIQFAAIPAALEKALPRGRAGALMARGDFVDGDFRGFDGQRVRVNSILFGTRTYEARKEVLAVTLRDPATNTTGYKLRLREHSILHTDTLRIDSGQWTGRDPIAGPFKVPFNEIIEIHRLSRAR